MRELAFKFDACIQQYNTRLDDTDARITTNEISVKEQLNHVTAKYAASATQHYNSLTEFASSTFTKFQANVI